MGSAAPARRRFLVQCSRLGLALGAGVLLDPSLAALKAALSGGGGRARAADLLDELIRQAPAARYWIASSAPEAACRTCHAGADLAPDADPDHAGRTMIKCLLCAQGCLIAEGERGRCGVRANDKGILRSLVYGRPVTTHVDPIEKKPFYHFLPGSEAFSLATVGCALHCKFCQNWEISQARPEHHAVAYVPPERIVDTADNRSAPIIAFTYNEPTVFCEYLVDIARLARQRGLRSVLVSCGFMNEAPLAEMCGCLDAIKIDLKGFSPEFYRRVCSAELQPVLRSIKQAARSGVHLELVNLVVPTLNDSPPMLKDLAAWVAGELGPDVPVHFTRFHPDYQLLNLPPTPVATLERARDLALAAGIRYAYVGNVPDHEGNHTYCPRCGRVVIRRRGFFVQTTDLNQGRCRFCDTAIAGVWQ